MTGTIGCIGLIGIAIFIVLLALWSRKSRKGVREFYAKYGMFSVDAPPRNVIEAIGVPKPLCLQASVSSVSGSVVPFHWWEWTRSSLHSTGTGVQGSISCFLAISFAPNTVTKNFEQKAIDLKGAKRSVLKRFKDIYALDTDKPIRVESLSDGTFVVFWQVIQRPKVMEDKIDWLKNNL